MEHETKATTEPPEVEPGNARIVAKLRETFEPIAKRLTPEVEPAVTYAMEELEP